MSQQPAQSADADAFSDIDVNRPSAARVYDYFLGGAHNFAVDRELAAQIQAMSPNIGDTMRANRRFLRRAVEHLAGEAGMRQFLDLGSGIPTVGNVHEVAQAIAPDSRVVYVDIDPVAVAHSQVILRDNELAAVLRADLREVDRILKEAAATGLIDFAEPVAVLAAGILHFIPDSDEPVDTMRRFGDALVPGSHLLVSHGTMDGQPEEVRRAVSMSTRTSTEAFARTHAEIVAMFAGFTLLEPGLVLLPDWRPEPGGEPDVRSHIGAYGGLARKDERRKD